MRTLTPPLALALAVSTLLAACSQPPAAEPDGTYTVRAEIVRLSPAPSRQVYLRHESIPDFRGRDGKASGMMSMTMPFELGEGIDQAALEVGDRFAATFEVRWSAKSPLRVTHLEPLSADTRLEFDPAAEPDADLQAEPDGGPEPDAAADDDEAEDEAVDEFDDDADDGSGDDANGEDDGSGDDLDDGAAPRR